MKNSTPRASRKTSSRTSRLTLGATVPPAGIGPPTREEPALPREQGFRGEEERAPPRAGEQPARRGQERTIGGPQHRARYLPAQHSRLMAQHDDLKLLEIRRAKAEQHERRHTPEHHIQERDRREGGGQVVDQRGPRE
jgi:hypothetical protein